MDKPASQRVGPTYRQEDTQYNRQQKVSVSGINDNLRVKMDGLKKRSSPCYLF